MTRDRQGIDKDLAPSTQDDWDEPLAGPDPDHPCPNCGVIPMAPGDGSARICEACGYTWWVRWSPIVDDGLPWHFWATGETLKDTTANARLANWEAADDPGQMALQAYLSGLLADLTPLPPGPLALVMDIVVPSAPGINRGFDLENYLTPVAIRLRGPFVFAWAKKRSGTAPSTVTVAQAIPANVEVDDSWESVSVGTTGSASSNEWKNRIRQLLIEKEVREVPANIELELQIVWRGRRSGRNWINLWKATGDALGPILGASHPDRPYDVNDGRITNLALHWNPIDTPSWDLALGIYWRPVTSGS